MTDESAACRFSTVLIHFHRIQPIIKEMIEVSVMEAKILNCSWIFLFFDVNPFNDLVTVIHGLHQSRYLLRLATHLHVVFDRVVL